MSRRAVGVYIDPRVDREVEHLAVDSGKSKSQLYEIGARLLLAVVRAGRLPDDLGYILQKHDETAIEELAEIIRRKNAWSQG